MSEGKFSKCGEGKNVSVKISGVREKRIERKVREKKNQSVFG